MQRLTAARCDAYHSSAMQATTTCQPKPTGMQPYGMKNTSIQVRLRCPKPQLYILNEVVSKATQERSDLASIPYATDEHSPAIAPILISASPLFSLSRSDRLPPSQQYTLHRSHMHILLHG